MKKRIYNDLFLAYINGKKDYGYFVNLCGGLTALYPEKSGSVHYEVGQSVNVHVDIVDTYLFSRQNFFNDFSLVSQIVSKLT